MTGYGQGPTTSALPFSLVEHFADLYRLRFIEKDHSQHLYAGLE
jgi:hypothetical protein